MNEEPKSIWKKSFKGRTAFVIWLAVAVFTVMLGSFFAALLNFNRPISDWLAGAGILAGFCLSACLVLIYVVWPLSRWLFWKQWRRGLFALACLTTLIALFYAEEDWRGWHAWNKFKHEWEAKGEKFDYASIVPPSVPDDQNFAMAPVFDVTDKLASRKWRQEHSNPHPVNGQWWDTNLVDPLQMEIEDYGYNSWLTLTNGGNWQLAKVCDLKEWQNYYRALAAKTNEFPIAPQPQTPAQDVLLALSKYDSAIEGLRQASQRPYSRFPLDYDDEDPAAILLPHLATLKRCTQVLQLRVLAELEAGQSEQALADVKLALHLADSVHNEPDLIAHLVRIAILQITLQPVWEGLAEHRWSEEQLVTLDAELAKLDFLADYKLSMRGEMGFQGASIDLLIRDRRYLSLVYSENGNSPMVPPFIHPLIPTGWFYQNRLNCARMMVEFYIPLADVSQQTISPAAVRRADDALKVETKKTTPYNILEKMLLPALGNVVKKFAYAQSSVNLARVAIALERYRLAHGEYPESLDALAPQFIEKVPHDIIGGGPLKYRRTSDGQFVLYSVGWNETDDGGVVVNQKSRDPRDESGNAPDISQGDWVWRYPSK